jgi:predicted PurR-regulated permease PerM
MKTQWNKWLLWGISIAFIYLCWVYLSHIIGYFIMAIIVAFIGRPLVNLLSDRGIFKLRLPRWLASLITLVVFGAMLFGISRILAPLVATQVTFLMNLDYVKILDGLEVMMSQWSDTLDEVGLWPSDEEWKAIMDKGLGMVSLNQMGIYFESILSIALSLLIGFLSVFFVAFYLLKEGELLNKIIFSVTPDNQVEKMAKAIENIKYLLSRYFLGLMLQIVIVAIIVFTGLSIVGVQNALVLGLIAGFFNLIPYIGPYIGAFFGIVLGITSELSLGNDTDIALFTLEIFLVFVCAQLVDNFVLQPIIFSKSVKAHPLEIFVVVLSSGSLFGILGMIAAIPVYTILRVVSAEFLPDLKIVRKLTEKIKSNPDKPIEERGE